MKKIILWVIVMFSLMPLAYAQAGLFSSDNATNFATVGIVIVVLFFAFRQIIRNIKGFKKKK